MRGPGHQGAEATTSAWCRRDPDACVLSLSEGGSLQQSSSPTERPMIIGARSLESLSRAPPPSPSPLRRGSESVRVAAVNGRFVGGSARWPTPGELTPRVTSPRGREGRRGLHRRLRGRGRTARLDPARAPLGREGRRGLVAAGLVFGMCERSGPSSGGQDFWLKSGKNEWAIVDGTSTLS